MKHRSVLAAAACAVIVLSTPAFAGERSGSSRNDASSSAAGAASAAGSVAAIVCPLGAEECGQVAGAGAGSLAIAASLAVAGSDGTSGASGGSSASSSEPRDWAGPLSVDDKTVVAQPTPKVPYEAQTTPTPNQQ